MKFSIRTLFIVLSISFVIGQNWNTNGMVPMTFRVTVEPYMPPGEIMSIEFWKNGAVEEPPANPHYKPTANRRFHVPMKKIGKNQWEAIVDLDTSSYEYVWGDSKFIYHYNRNHFMPAMQNREPLKTPQMPDGQYMPLPSDNPENANRNGFGWHRRANMVQNDTIKEWWWPFPDPEPTLNTTGHLSSPPNNLKSSDFMTGIGFYDWHRYYWSSVIENWMDNVVRTNSTWMMIVPVRHGIKQNPPEFDFENKHSNALPDSNFVKMIKEAHKRGLKVYVNNLEVLGGYMNWDESVINREWYIKWLAERRKDMLHLATIAQEHGVEMFKFNLWHIPRIIDEYESLVDSISLVVLNEVKAIYKGKIIMDWRDKDPTLKIYESADMFRVTLMLNNLTGYGFEDSDEPSVENILVAARKKMNNEALPIYQKYEKPILLEFLYASSYEGAAGSAGSNWDYVPGISHFFENDPTIPIDEQVQANMYEAGLVLAHEYDWLVGASSFNYGIAAINDKEASIRGKLAEQVVRKWYRWINPNKTHLTTTINENTTIAPYTQGGTVSHQGSYVLSKDTTVTVTASADDGYGFVKWTGDASGTSPSVTVSMDTDKEISAIFYKNLPPSSFTWISPTEYDSISIDRDNLATKYSFKWTQSIDVEDLTYNINDKFGNTLFSFTDTVGSVTYEEILSLWPEQFKILPRMTLEYDAVATDEEFSTTITGGLRKLYINRYDYLSTEGEGIPTEFALHENYPNPFNPTTILRFDLPEVSNLTLTIYNMLGQKVKTFSMQSIPAGYHSVTWDATNDLGVQVGAGVYLYQLQTKDFIKTRKMVLLK
jgi:uncharacterized repeat protein (TIGR02543 family)